MKTKMNQSDESIVTKYTEIGKLKRAEKLAWFFFVGIGVAYIALSLIMQFA